MNNNDDYEDDDSFDLKMVDTELISAIESAVKQSNRTSVLNPQTKQPVIKMEQDNEVDSIFEDELNFGDDVGFEEAPFDTSGAWDPEKKSLGLNKGTRVKIIVCSILVLISIAGILIFSVKDKAVKNLDVIPSASAPNTLLKEPVVDTVVPHKGDSISRIYEDYVELPDNFYADSLITSKYMSIENGVCNYYFLGIPANFRKEVSFQVSIEEYNSIANGSKVSIEYKIFRSNGQDYLTGVKLKKSA